MANKNIDFDLTEYLKEKQILPPQEIPQEFHEIAVDIEKLSKWSKN